MSVTPIPFFNIFNRLFFSIYLYKKKVHFCFVTTELEDGTRDSIKSKIEKLFVYILKSNLKFVSQHGAIVNYYIITKCKSKYY